MRTKHENIGNELKARASAVGYTVDDTQAQDGTYWIPSIGHWRSVAQIEETVSLREAQLTSGSACA